MQLLSTLSIATTIADIPTPKFAIGQILNFPYEGKQICIGMIYIAEPDDKGWWYYYSEPGFGEVGSHELYVEQVTEID